MRLVTYKLADPKWGFRKNVYREVLTAEGVGVTIGVALRLQRWCLSLVWRKP